MGGMGGMGWVGGIERVTSVSELVDATRDGERVGTPGTRAHHREERAGHVPHTCVGSSVHEAHIKRRAQHKCQQSIEKKRKISIALLGAVMNGWKDGSAWVGGRLVEGMLRGSIGCVHSPIWWKRRRGISRTPRLAHSSTIRSSAEKGSLRAQKKQLSTDE
jgi:hypothetical protein